MLHSCHLQQHHTAWVGPPHPPTASRRRSCRVNGRQPVPVLAAAAPAAPAAAAGAGAGAGARAGAGAGAGDAAAAAAAASPTEPAWPRRAALLAAAALAGCRPAAAAAAPTTSQAQQQDAAAFYAQYPYAAPADILPFVRARAPPNDVQAVLDALDEFGRYYPQYKLGPEKGRLLEREVLAAASKAAAAGGAGEGAAGAGAATKAGAARPLLVLEVGTFLGYSALRIARHLATTAPAGGRLLCVEANAANAAVARTLLDYAGVGGCVTVLDGLASQVIPRLPQLLQEQQPGSTGASSSSSSVPQQQQQQQPWTSGPQQQQRQACFDVVFLDHAKEAYLPDLQALEGLGLVQPGTLVAADNVLYPGAPGFLEYLDAAGADGGGPCRYATRLLAAPYEYEQPWNPAWQAGRADALSISLCLTPRDAAASGPDAGADAASNNKNAGVAAAVAAS